MKETLEEAIKPKVIQRIISSTDAQTASKEILELFNKWQSERMYSEEDIREAFKIGHKVARQGSYNSITEQEDFEKWFSQFKKGQ